MLTYLLGNYSFFDTQAIIFDRYEKSHELLGDLASNEKVKRIIHISEGWYTIFKKENQLFYNDLRFGLLSMDKGSQNFVFKYEIIENADGEIQFIERKKDKWDGEKLTLGLWKRFKWN